MCVCVCVCVCVYVCVFVCVCASRFEFDTLPATVPGRHSATCSSGLRFHAQVVLRCHTRDVCRMCVDDERSHVLLKELKCGPEDPEGPDGPEVPLCLTTDDFALIQDVIMFIIVLSQGSPTCGPRAA